MRFKVGDKVEIIPFIALLQPFSYEKMMEKAGIMKIHRQYGTIKKINGSYIDVKPKMARFEIECYSAELKLMSKEDYKLVKNFKRK